jgi:hypothetical protein
MKVTGSTTPRGMFLERLQLQTQLKNYLSELFGKEEFEKKFIIPGKAVIDFPGIIDADKVLGITMDKDYIDLIKMQYYYRGPIILKNFQKVIDEMDLVKEEGEADAFLIKDTKIGLEKDNLILIRKILGSGQISIYIPKDETAIIFTNERGLSILVAPLIIEED